MFGVSCCVVRRTKELSRSTASISFGAICLPGYHTIMITLLPLHSVFILSKSSRLARLLQLSPIVRWGKKLSYPQKGVPCAHPPLTPGDGSPLPQVQGRGAGAAGAGASGVTGVSMLSPFPHPLPHRSMGRALNSATNLVDRCMFEAPTIFTTSFDGAKNPGVCFGIYVAPCNTHATNKNETKEARLPSGVGRNIIPGNALSMGLSQ